MSDRKQTLLYRTSVEGATAQTTNLGEGELAININSKSPFLMFKNSDGNLEKVGAMQATTGDSENVTMTQKAITNEFKLPAEYVKPGYPLLEDVVFDETKGGDTLHQSIQNVDTNVSKLVQETINNEEVIAKSITVLRDTLGLDQNLLIGDGFKGTKLEGCKTIVEALITLATLIK